MSNTKKVQFTNNEKQTLSEFKKHTEEIEMKQVQDLMINCNNPYQFAKTHSNYVKDWEKVKQKMLDRLENKDLPKDTRPELLHEMIKIGDQIIEKKLKNVREIFFTKFKKSIYDYIGYDGKTKGCFSVILFFIITTSITMIYLII